MRKRTHRLGAKQYIMAALPDLITVAQFRRLAEDGDHMYELQKGEVVALIDYSLGSKIPLAAFGSSSLAVDEIFA